MTAKCVNASAASINAEFEYARCLVFTVIGLAADESPVTLYIPRHFILPFATLSSTCINSALALALLALVLDSASASLVLALTLTLALAQDCTRTELFGLCPEMLSSSFTLFYYSYSLPFIMLCHLYTVLMVYLW